MSSGDTLPEFCAKRTLILGCGNRLFGDDGFGGRVVECLYERYSIPDDAYVMDVGTGVRKLLFTLGLSPALQRRIVIIDAVDQGRSPGEIYEISLDDLPAEKADDFSLHQAPSTDLARALKASGAELRVLVCQVERIPLRVQPGLSAPVAEAVPRMAAWIAREFFRR